MNRKKAVGAGFLVICWLVSNDCRAACEVNLSLPAPKVADSFQFPVPNYSVTGYQFAELVPPKQVRHLGEDVLASPGTPIVAIGNGNVIYSCANIQGYEQAVVIEHRLPDNTFAVSVHGHLSRKPNLPLRSVGPVQRGEIIGYVGDDAENGEGGPHLHLGIRKGPHADQWVYYGRAGGGEDVDIDLSGNNIGGLFTSPTKFITSRSGPTLAISTSSCPKGTSCSGPQGTTFNFDGTSFTPDGTVRRFIEDSTGTQTELTPLLSADSSGQLSWSFTSTCATPVGTFLVFAVDSTTGTSSNRVTEIITAGNCPVLLPDLTITKADSPDPVTSDAPLTYTIIVQNIGSGDAADADVSDILPTGSTFQSCSVPCSVAGSSVAVTLGPLAAGATTSFNIVVTAPTVSVLTDIINVASVSTTTTESDPTNNQASVSTTVNPVPVSVTVSPATVTLPPGGSQTFTATVTGTNNTTVIWSVLEGTAGGTVATDGFYAAPVAEGMFHVLATSQSDSTKSAMATVTVVQAPNSFIPTGNMTTTRSAQTATLLADGRVLIAGGFGPFVFASAELYAPGTGIFSATDSMTIPRREHTSKLLANGKVLIVGGFSTIGAGDIVESSAELYDPTVLGGTFSLTDSMSVARAAHTATVLLDGNVLVAGGGAAIAELYDPSSGTSGAFVQTDSMSTPRDYHTATLLQDGKVFITGGFGSDGITASMTAELYDPTVLGGTFSLTDSMSVARAAHTATVLADGKVLIAGGEVMANGTVLATAELYDPATGVFSPTASMNVARKLHTATLLPDGKVLVAGGFNFSSGSLASAELYDPTLGTFTFTDSMNTARLQHTATLLPNGNVLVAGPDSSAEIYIFAITP